MQAEIEHINNDFERAEYLQVMLLAHSTGGSAEDRHYVQIRKTLLESPNYESLIPRCVKTNRNLDQFWQFIKNKGNYI